MKTPFRSICVRLMHNLERFHFQSSGYERSISVDISILAETVRSLIVSTECQLYIACEVSKVLKPP